MGALVQTLLALQEGEELKISQISYRVFIKYCVFPLNFLNSASSAAALVFYLPGVCTRNDIERKQSQEYILKASKKHNI